MRKTWRIHSHDPHAVARLQEQTNVPALVAHLLICRGITDPAAAIEFLSPRLSGLRDPDELPGVVEASAVLHDAIRAGRKLVVYGDYDVDGMTGAAILLRCFKLLGAQVDYYIPHRLEEGYGVNREAIESLAAQGAELIVTVDCGITSVEEAATARRLGLQMVITDHHKPGERLPDVEAIVHPGLADRPYPFAGLAGSGVAFKLAWAVCQRACGEKRVSAAMREYLMQAVGLAAMGTVADMVPLIDENRVLVRQGLEKSLRQHLTTGVAALIKASQLTPGQELSCEDIGFTLAPRLNAAGRLGQARLAVELLTTDREDRAIELARYVCGLNDSRQKLERSVQHAAVHQINQHFDLDDDAALVIAERGWHQGIIGIVAGRLAERYHRPVVLLAMDSVGAKAAVGSARSVPGFDLHAALAACGEHLLGFGGHAAAAGLQIDESKIDDFRAALCDYVAAEWKPDDRVAELEIDAEFPLAAFTQQSVREMEWLAPFGQANRRPVLCTTAATIAEAPKLLGSGERHMSVRLKHQRTVLRAVGFGRGEWVEEMPSVGQPIDIVFRPVLNKFAGRVNVELHLIDWRPHEQKQRESA